MGLFFLEARAAVLVPMGDLQNQACERTALGGCNLSWGARPEIGVAGGLRAWDPLLLDVGLRVSYGVQWLYSVGDDSHRYDPGIGFLEVAPFARGAIFPFSTDRWGISAQLSIGPLFVFGGKRDATDFPRDSQMMLRIRTAFGGVWRWKPSLVWVFEAASLTTDVSVTGEFVDNVGTVVSWEPSVAFQYRF